MIYETDSRVADTQREAAQMLGLMGGALLIATMLGQGGSGTVMGIIAFCIALMTMIAGGLFLFEGRLDESKRDAILMFCPPAVCLLGFSEALLVAAGYWGSAIAILMLAFLFAAYRGLLSGGAFNLFPRAARDLGVLGGLGAAGAGFVLLGFNAFQI